MAIKRPQQFETVYAGEIQDGRCIGDNDQRCFRLAQSPKVLAELLYSVMNRNLAFRQQRLKGELAHLRKTAGFREG